MTSAVDTDPAHRSDGLLNRPIALYDAGIGPEGRLYLSLLKADWHFDPLRKESRFKAIEARMNYLP